MEAYGIAKRNGGAAGIDNQNFDDIKTQGRTTFLAAIREDLVTDRYKPKPNRRVDIPKGNGKVRTLQIPCIRDRVAQGAVKLILEAIFEADFCTNSYRVRRRRSPHRALVEVRRSVLRRMSTVIEVDLSCYFDTIRQSVLLDKIAKRVQDPQVLHLVKQIIKVGGKIGVPQGGRSARAFDAIRRKTAEGPYEAVNYHRFADDIVIILSCHHTKRGWAARAQQRLQEQLTPLGVELNQEKTKVVDRLKDETFGFLGFDLGCVRKRQGNGHYLQMTLKKKARKAIKAKVRDIIRHGGSTPLLKVVEQVNASLAEPSSPRSRELHRRHDSSCQLESSGPTVTC
jgi:RNA-directed DNA polymerase